MDDTEDIALADDEPTPPPRKLPRHGRTRRIITRIIELIGVLFVGGLIFLYWASREGHLGRWAREEVVLQLHQACEVDATFESFTFDPFPPQITMSGLEMKHTDGRPLISVEEAIVSLQILPIFARRIQLDRVALLAPKATIELRDGQILDLPPCVKPKHPEETTTPIVLGIRDLTIERGRFDLIDDDVFEARLESIGVQLTPRPHSSGSAVAIGVDEGQVIVRSQVLPLHRFRFQGQIEGLLTAPRAVVLETVALDLASMKIAGSGAIDLLGPTYEAKLKVETPIDQIHQFVPEAPPTQGDVQLEVSMTGTAIDPSGVGRLVLKHIRVAEFGLGDDVTVDFQADRKGANIHSLLVHLADGTVKAKGRVDFDGERFPVHLDTEEDNISLGHVLDEVAPVKGPWVDWRADGKSGFHGTLNPLLLEGPFDFNIHDFYVFDRAFNKPEVRDRSAIDPKHILLKPGPINVSGKWKWEETGLTIVESVVASGTTHGRAHARIGFHTADGIHIESELHSLDFADVGPIAGIHFGGHGTVSGVIQGPLTDIGATGTVELEDTTITGIPFGHTRAELTWHDDTHLEFHKITGKLGQTNYSGDVAVVIERDVPFNIRGSIDSGRVEDVLVPFGVVAAEWGDPSGQITHGTFELTGPITRLSGPMDISFQKGALVGETFEKGRAVGRMEDGAVVLEDLEVEKHGASITGRGRIDPATLKVRASMLAHGMTLQKIDLMKASQPALDGKLALSLQLGGRLDALTGTVSARFTEVTAGPLDLPPGALVGRFHGPALFVKGKLLGGALAVDGDLDLARKLPYRGTLELAKFDVPKVLGALQGHLRWTGHALGRAKLSGSLVEWYLSNGEIQLEEAAIDTGSLHLETAAPAQLTMKNGVLETKHIAFSGPRTRMSAEGRLGARILDLKVLGNIDLAIVELVSPSVERSGGNLVLDGAVQGAPGNMNLVGTGHIDSGILQWRGFDGRLTGFSADLVFSQSTVLIDRAQGRFADGRVDVTGNVLLSDYHVKNISLAINLDDVRPHMSYPLVELSGMLNGPMSVEGTPDHLILRGELDVRHAFARPRLDITNLAGDRGRLAVNVYDPSQEIFDMDIAFHAVDPLRVKNDTLDAELRGDLRLTGTNQRFGLLGTTNLVRGGRVSVIGKEYELVSGVIEFQDRYRFSPRYDLSLATEACGAHITVNVVGTLQQKPEATYASNPEMDETNILSCLIRGVKVQDRYEDFTGLASRGLTHYSGIDREVKKVLPVDDIDVSVEYSSQTKTYEPRVLIAKELNILGGPARLEYSSALGKKEDQEIRLRYRITPGLTLQGGWAASKDVQPLVGDLHLDLKYRWEW